MPFALAIVHVQNQLSIGYVLDAHLRKSHPALAAAASAPNSTPALPTTPDADSSVGLAAHSDAGIVAAAPDAACAASNAGASTSSATSLGSLLAAEHGGRVIAEMRMSDGYVDATKMCQSGGKLWSDYYRLAVTKACAKAVKSRYVCYV
jgi:hypothetical protein